MNFMPLLIKKKESELSKKIFTLCPSTYNIEDLLPYSGVEGTLKFSSPSLYIFPSGDSTCAFFCVSSNFSLLLDTGCQREAPFWKLLLYCHNVDGVLLSSWSPCNLLGLQSLLKRAIMHHGKPFPSVFHKKFALFHAPLPCDLNLKMNTNNNNNKEEEKEEVEVNNNSKSSLNFDAVHFIKNECSAGAHQLKNTQFIPLVTSKISLYQHLLEGSLDLYPLCPNLQSTSYKNFLDSFSEDSGRNINWSQGSVSCILVWKPASKTEIVRRVLITGICSQNQILASLSKIDGNVAQLLRDFDVFPSSADLHVYVPDSASKPSSTTSSMAGSITRIRANEKSLHKASPTAVHSPSTLNNNISKGPLPSASGNVKTSTTTATKLPSTPSSGTGTNRKVVTTPSSRSKPPSSVTVSLTTATTTSSSSVKAPLKGSDTPVIGSSYTNSSKSTPKRVNASSTTSSLKKGIITPSKKVLPSQNKEEKGVVAVEGDDIVSEPTLGLPPVLEQKKGQPPASRGSTASTTPRSIISSAKTTPSSTSRLKPSSNPSTTRPKSKASDHNSSASLTPCYVDCCMMPNTAIGDDAINEDFFKWIRSKNYVFSSLNPRVEVLNALLTAKESWASKDKDQLVTIIPTYNSGALLRWIFDNQERLLKLKIAVEPAVINCVLSFDENAVDDDVVENERIDTSLNTNFANAYRLNL